MKQAAISAVIVFALSFTTLSIVELIIHRLAKNRNKTYRWGVWVFSILLAGYAFLTTLGR